MKRILLSLALAAISTAALAKSGGGSGRPDVYVTQTWKPKADVPYEKIKTAAEALNVVFRKAKGCEKRNLFFDKAQNLWIDQSKWKHADAAEGGIKTVEADPLYKQLKDLMDVKTLQVTKSERILELDVE